MIARLFVHLRQQWMGALALLLVLGGGTAYAANTVFSSDIVDGQVKTPDLANGAVANAKLAGGAVTSEKVADESLRGRDVLQNTLRGADIDESTLSSIGGGGPAGGDLSGTYPDPEIAASAVGAAEIATGAVGSSELADNLSLEISQVEIPPAGGVGDVGVSCPASALLLSGGAGFEFPSGDLVRSDPGIPGVGGLWVAEGQNNGNFDQLLRVYAICLDLA